MRLIYLHGPPAAGKFTIAEALRAEVGVRNFHNHLTLDVAKALFDFGSEPFWKLVNVLRIEALRAAASDPDLTVVVTGCYSHPDDADVVYEIESIVTGAGGQFLPVFLACERAELEARVTAPSRAAMRKVSTVAGLRKNLESWNCIALPHPRCTTLVTDGKTASQTASELIAMLDLRATS